MNKIYFLIFTFLLSSCSDFPIVFTKHVNNTTGKLTLIDKKLFKQNHYTQEGKEICFSGQYKIEDSIVILEYDRDTVNRTNNIQLNKNDTFLIMKYGERTFLFPFVSYFPSITSSDYKQRMMKNIINYYTTNEIEKSIGTFHLELTDGNLSAIYKGTSVISPYYDRFISITKQ